MTNTNTGLIFVYILGTLLVIAFTLIALLAKKKEENNKK